MFYIRIGFVAERVSGAAIPISNLLSIGHRIVVAHDQSTGHLLTDERPHDPSPISLNNLTMTFQQRATGEPDPTIRMDGTGDATVQETPRTGS